MNLPQPETLFFAGKELRFRFSIASGPFGRTYRCELRIKPSAAFPEMFVLSPDLKLLANGKQLPHVYPSEGSGVRLCLWLPMKREWMAGMPLRDTYIAWTAEWLTYFELWLATGEWLGGGVHLDSADEKLQGGR
ncbi:hypothetical protein J2X90_005704 [Variovorax paradoxus]|uniref:hypothetical protein n=1 Tax=Variovorax paradoxus TaxID=34073 RepID=UPI00277FE582|nr:hypothetical protein [Variovorax paradoxus]MDQ0027868.1 hypothetical protein [Variovorax paradoxus]